jgi:hypothetical protein
MSILDNNSWLFLYSQITSGLIGKQLLFDSSNGIVTNPTYGNGLFRATDTSGNVSIVADKATDNFYDLTVNVLNNFLTSELAIQANWFGEKSTGTQTLLGYMSDPTLTGINNINLSGLTNSTTKYHTLLFNINLPSTTASITINYFNSSAYVIDTTVIASLAGNYIYQLNNTLVYDSITIEFNSNSSSSKRTNIVGLLQTDSPLTPSNLVCFGEGSLVFTPSGEVPIENLKQGDQIYDENLSVQTVEFIAKRTVFPSKTLNKYSIPIEIKQGQLGDNVPRKDTLVSSAHLIKHNGQMVPASTLGTEASFNSVITYYNVKVSNYSTMIVNGLVSETLDTSTDTKVYEKVY